ncbi:phage tail tape measure protein [Staphylococcus gallinarum]|nr:phage tail tape measure protein [Staphylococcus gallinarum]KIR10679.1 bacteriophage tail protein [Staphylococcus gallinarum]RTX82883.1 phage tail tape measure protein [Staphylococcus gallinarum]GEQ04572.1 phage tail tape measure protein [Staphylococcus gallinarum]
MQVQGLTIRNTMDNGQVEASVKSLKRQLTLVNSEMRANLSAFDKSEKSMSKYKLQLKSLNEKIKIQKKVFHQAEDNLKSLNENFKDAKNRVSSVEKEFKSLTETNKRNKDALDKSNVELKKNNTELNKLKRQQDRTNESRDKAYKELQRLRKAEKDLKNDSKASSVELNRASKAVEKQSQKHKDLVSKYAKEREEINKLKDDNKKLSTSNEKIASTYNKTNTKLQQTEKEYEELTKTILEHDKNLSNATIKVNNECAALNKLENTVGKVTDEMKAFHKEQLISNSQFTKTANRADQLSNKFGNMSGKMKDVGRTMTMGVTTPVTLGFGAAIKTSADFEAGMSRVGAIAQASGKDLKAMKSEAMELGAKTSKSASEVSKGMEELAALGFNAKQTMAAMPGVISAAEASGADMAETATVMASSINSFNLKAKDSSHVADVLAVAANDSAADVKYMGEALKYAGTPAHSLGVSLEDTSAAIEVMSNAGLEGSQAGTVLRASFIRLANPTGKAAALMKEMGIHLTDNKGKFVGMGDLIGQFKMRLQGMNKEQKLATISQIVGTEAASGFLAMVDAGPKKIDKFSNSLKNSDGASKKAAKQMRDNLKGSIEQLKGAFETLGIQIGNDLTPAIRAGARFVTKFTEGFTKLPGWVRKSTIGLTLFAAAIGPVILAGGVLAGVISKAMHGYANLNKQMAINTAEAAINAGANKTAAGSLATSGKATKSSTGLFSNLGQVLTMTMGKYGKLGKVVLKGAKFFKAAGLPLTILTTIFGVAYEKMDWFRQGFKDMGRIVNDVGANIDFSWLPNLSKAWDNFKTDMAKGMEDGALFKGIHKAFNGIHSLASKASDKVNVLGKGVSKETKSSLGTYMKYSERSNQIFEKIRYNHGNITKKEANELISINKKMSDELIKQLEKRKNKELKNAHDVLDNSKAISSKRKQAIIAHTTDEANVRIRKVKELNMKIANLEAKATTGKLSKEETKQLQSLYEKRNKLAVKSLSKGEKEQQRILARMSANRKAMSISEASQTIKESIKARDAAKKAAKKRYDAKIDEINQMKGLSKSEKKTLLREAEDKYNKEVKTADKGHKKILKNVKRSNKNVKNEIDLSNGKVKSGFQKHWSKLKDDSKKAWDKMGKNAQHFGKTMSGAGKWFKGLPKAVGKHFGKAYGSVKDYTGKISKKTKDKFSEAADKAGKHSKGLAKSTGKWFGKAYGSVKEHAGNILNKTKTKYSDAADKANKHSKSLSKNTGKWFGKAYSSVKEHAGNILNKTKDKYSDAADKAGKHSKSLAKSTGKWFGKAYASVKEHTGNMRDKAKSAFGDMASKAWDKAKSIYKGFTDWLGRTLNWIKNIGKDFGKAASDLGKTVANKAVDGLNGMIGGINKISKAITDKNLIKPIPKLSTGTYNGSSLATDSEGGLKQPTLAVVNDRGSGNAPGGGVQEVIHRADGTLHAPQGPDVVVPLGVGDSVINARDTKKMQNMGVLPRFASGTKKKKGLLEKVSDNVKGALGKAKDMASEVGHTASDGVEKLKDVGEKGASWLGEALGDVMDWIDKPKELVNKVFDSLGLSFGKGNNATVKMVKGAYSKLKTLFIDKVKSMFDEFGGDGDGGYIKYLDNITTPYSPNGPPPGYAFNWAHPGIDLPYHHEPVQSTVSGKAYRKYMPNGFGNYVLVKSGNLEVFYGHLLKYLIKNGQSVRPGTKLAISGGALSDPGHGASTGMHLHYEMHQNGKPINPVKWLKSHNGSGGGKSGQWDGDVRKALRLAGLPTTPAYVRAWKSQIHTESTGNPRAKNPSGASGLVQVKPDTFAAYKLPGHGNIWNGLDNLIAGMRYAKARYKGRMLDQIGHGLPYANGGMITHHQIAEMGEGNKPEMVIPLTKRTRAIQLIEQAMRYVGMDRGSTNVTVNNDNSLIEKLLKQMVAMNDHNNRLTATIVDLLKSIPKGADPRKAEQLLSQLQGDRYARTAYNMGG